MVRNPIRLEVPGRLRHFTATFARFTARAAWASTTTEDSCARSPLIQTTIYTICARSPLIQTTI